MLIMIKSSSRPNTMAQSLLNLAVGDPMFREEEEEEEEYLEAEVNDPMGFSISLAQAKKV